MIYFPGTQLSMTGRAGAAEKWTMWQGIEGNWVWSLVMRGIALTLGVWDGGSWFRFLIPVNGKNPGLANAMPHQLFVPSH